MKYANLLNNTNRYKVNNNIVNDKDMYFFMEMDAFKKLESKYEIHCNNYYNELVDEAKQNGFTSEQLMEIKARLNENYEILEVQKGYMNIYYEEGFPIITTDDLIYDVIETVYLIEAEYYAIDSYSNLRQYVIENLE